MCGIAEHTTTKGKKKYILITIANADRACSNEWGKKKKMRNDIRYFVIIYTRNTVKEYFCYLIIEKKKKNWKEEKNRGKKINSRKLEVRRLLKGSALYSH